MLLLLLALMLLSFASEEWMNLLWTWWSRALCSARCLCRAGAPVAPSSSSCPASACVLASPFHGAAAAEMLAVSLLPLLVVALLLCLLHPPPPASFSHLPLDPSRPPQPPVPHSFGVPSSSSSVAAAAAVVAAAVAAARCGCGGAARLTVKIGSSARVWTVGPRSEQLHRHVLPRQAAPWACSHFAPSRQVRRRQKQRLWSLLKW